MLQDDTYYERTVLMTIARVKRQTEGKGEQAFKQELKRSYPFGERVGRPYRIWRELTKSILKNQRRVD